MPTNSAAWINAKKSRLEVGPAPYPTPRPDQIVIRSRAVAINPLDWIIQVAGNLAYRWLKYPTVLGSDVAGEVVEIGSEVTRFQVGDRVLGHAVGTDKDSNRAAEGTFQVFVAVLEVLASPIPDDLPYEDAAVLPLAVSTAACGLFQTDQLGLRHPSSDAEPTGETVLVWGGATSVGSNAIQLAVAAGYDVITTASPHNFGFVRSLGAGQVFDYHSPTVVPDVIRALDGRTLAGTIAFGTTSGAACLRIVAAAKGKKFVSMASPPVSFAVFGDVNRNWASIPRTMFRLITSSVAQQIRARARGIGTKFIFGTTLKANEVGPAIYRDFLPGALAAGRYVPSPRPTVVGSGLEQIQRAMDLQREGVSATKLVVTLL